MIDYWIVYWSIGVLLALRFLDRPMVGLLRFLLEKEFQNLEITDRMYFWTLFIAVCVMALIWPISIFGISGDDSEDRY